MRRRILQSILASRDPDGAAARCAAHLHGVVVGRGLQPERSAGPARSDGRRRSSRRRASTASSRAVSTRLRCVCSCPPGGRLVVVYPTTDDGAARARHRRIVRAVAPRGIARRWAHPVRCVSRCRPTRCAPCSGRRSVPSRCWCSLSIAAGTVVAVRRPPKRLADPLRDVADRAARLAEGDFRPDAATSRHPRTRPRVRRARLRDRRDRRAGCSASTRSSATSPISSAAGSRRSGCGSTSCPCTRTPRSWTRPTRRWRRWTG